MYLCLGATSTLAARAAPSTVLSCAHSQNVGAESEISFPCLLSSRRDSVVETQRLLGFRKVWAVLSVLSQRREEEARWNFFCIAPKLFHVIDHTCGDLCFGEEWPQPWSFRNLVEFSHLVFLSSIAHVDIVRGIGGTWGDPVCFLHAAYRRTKHGLSKWVHVTKPEDGFYQRVCLGEESTSS